MIINARLFCENLSIMKKSIILLPALMFGFAFKCFAGTGNARDGYLVLAILIGMLLVTYAISFIFDFLNKNGKQVVQKIVNKWHVFRQRHAHYTRKSSHERFEMTIS